MVGENVQRGSTWCPLWNDLDGYWHGDVVALSRPLRSRARLIPSNPVAGSFSVEVKYLPF